MNWLHLFLHDPFVFLAGFCTFVVLALSGYVFLVTRDMERHLEGPPEPPPGDVPRIPHDMTAELSRAAAFHAATTPGKN